MRKPTHRVVITGTGAISALGDSTDALWEGLLASCCGIRRLSRFVEIGLPVTTGGEVVSIPYYQIDRDEVIASRAIEAAFSEAELSSQNVGFLWATGLDTFQVSENGFTYRSAGKCFTALAKRFTGHKRMIATACASGTQAIGEAFNLIRDGQIECCIAGGSSTMLTPFYLIGFAGLQAIAIDNENENSVAVCCPFDRKRRGFTLADGAGAVVLETLDSARRRGVKILGEVIGFGVSQDAFDLNRPAENGVGAILCMERSLINAGISPKDIDAVNAHGTATYLGDLAEAAAIRYLFGEKIPVSGIKGAVGHAMAAAGALEAIVALKTCVTGIVPPTVNLVQPDENCELNHVIGEPLFTDAKTVLSVSFGMGGQNAGIILRRMNNG
ncbi:MAG: beta-ketoacyl-[acyl-carrier-protein] synthase family protein [bacterium]|nr:MAG: beta-ketoacyl-[acyl-carrier-protein] synthase family protein [bacterium]